MDLSTPSPPATPPPAPTEVEANTDPLDALLRQIIGGWFILTDGQGAVSKWSEPAELLFGKEAPDALGHSFFEGLLAGRLSEDAEQWRRFLAAGDPPRARAQVEAEARHAPSGRTFALEAVLVPVKLDEGFDFSLFLEDLSFELPMNLMLLRMRQQHPVVVRALKAALASEPQEWEGWRTAGTLVAFRPLVPTPWVQEELTRRAEERARQDAEREEALTNTDPGVQGESVDDLDDAAAVVARLLSAMERIDELERMAGRLPAAVEEARRDARAGVARAEAAEREAAALRAELGRAPAGDPEVLGRLERLERATREAEHERRRAADGALAELAAAREADASTQADLAAMQEYVGGLQLAPEPDLQPLLDKLAAIEAQDAVALDELRRHVAHLDERTAGPDPALEDLGRRVEALRERGAERHELHELQRAFEALRDGGVGRTDLDAIREQLGTLADGWAAKGDVLELRSALDALSEHVRGRLEELAPASELEALHGRLDGVRDGLARAADVEALRAGLVERLDRVRDGLAPSSDLEALHERVDGVRAGLATAADAEALRSRLEGLAAGADLDALRHRVDGLAAASDLEAVHHRFEGLAAAADLDALRQRLDGVRDGLATADALSDLSDRLEGVASVSDLDEVRGRLGRVASADDLSDLRGRLDGLASADDLSALRGRLDGLAAADELDTLRAAVGELRDAASDANARIAAIDRGAGSVLDEVRSGHEAIAGLRAEVAALREETVAARQQAELASAVAERARADAARFEALQAEVQYATAMVDDMKAGLTSAGQAALTAQREAEQARQAAEHAGEGTGEHVNAVFREILGLAAKNKPAKTLHKPVRETAPAARDPREGFDDDSVPLAVIGLDGRFKELNPSFCRLVGYQEHEFAKAAWPSPHDRQVYALQQEQFRQLVAGELPSVPVQSTYMHGQGLMVPVIGELTVEHDERGLPARLLLRAEERDRTF